MNYIKKQVIFKSKNKMEFREDIPRRWLEQVGNSERGMSRRKGSFEGMLGLGGILAIPDGYKPNENLAMSDGFKLANNSISSPINKIIVSFPFSLIIQDAPTSSATFDKTDRNYHTLVAAAKHLKLPEEATIDEPETMASDVGKMSSTPHALKKINHSRYNTSEVAPKTAYSNINNGLNNSPQLTNYQVGFNHEQRRVQPSTASS